MARDVLQVLHSGKSCNCQLHVPPLKSCSPVKGGKEMWTRFYKFGMWQSDCRGWKWLSSYKLQGRTLFWTQWNPFCTWATCRPGWVYWRCSFRTGEEGTASAPEWNCWRWGTLQGGMGMAFSYHMTEVHYSHVRHRASRRQSHSLHIIAATVPLLGSDLTKWYKLTMKDSEDSTVITVPLPTEVSWPVWRVPLPQGWALPGNTGLALGQLEKLQPRAALVAAAAAEGQDPWQSSRAGQQRGYLRHSMSSDPKSHPEEPDHPGFPADPLQAPRERSLSHLSPVSSLCNYH